ncbi:hypothetical protein EHQ82_17000 [Leptospira selangorensis]|uniref:Outer membrane protein beta-barrel domain-containing protein n=1 Tax=Leptospira selangorensis TaxID=2484982 RepID=A0ABY2N3W0_9LEPT|nr:hypothetical protein [Leptospira selangorensis]TGM16531.1 hypothetical protein EHQ82_17000 [Leptospira selangorensis]
MNRIFITILCALTFAQTIYSESKKASTTTSSAGNFGIGISLFGPTGVSGKYTLDDKSAIEGSIGFGTIGNGRSHLHAVYLYNFMELSPAVNLYLGGGGVFQERSNDGNQGRGKGIGNLFRDRTYESSFGIRAPLGMSFRTEDKRFELSAEVYLHLFLTGKDGSDLGLALAGRYYF